MKTIKEIAEQLEVSKPTVSKAIQKLGIEKQKIANRIVISEEDVAKIEKFISPEGKAEIEKSEKAEKSDRKTAKIEYNSADIDSNSADTDNPSANTNKASANSDKRNANSNNSSAFTDKASANNAKNENSILIEMLQKALDEKEQTIKAQQNQIDMLIKSNAMLTARLEDKHQQEETIIEAEQVRRPFWKRLFGIR